MRIALVTRQFLSDGDSGIVRATRDLAGGLAAAGHVVHVLAAPRRARSIAPPLPPPGVRVVVVPDSSRRARARAVHAAAGELHEADGLDVLCVPLWDAEGLDVVADPRFASVVSCMTTTATMAALDPARASAFGAEEATRLERAVLARARHLHGLSEAALAAATEGAELAAVTRRVVPRGLRDRAGGGAPEAERPGPVEILFAGRLETRKGVDVLLAAFGRLLAEGVDVRLTLVGPGEEEPLQGAAYRREWLRRAPPEHAARVTWTGPVTDAELDARLARAAIVCLPSRYESHGIVLTEAMMFGRPIVSTLAGGIPEVVEEGGNALLAEPGDPVSLARALRALAEDPARRAAFGARSRSRFLERHALGRVTAAMEQLFADALAAEQPAESPA